jgi:hypothetical protein
MNNEANNGHQEHFRQRPQQQQIAGGGIATDEAPPPRTRKPARRSLGDRITTSGCLTRDVGIDDNYAKYGKRNVNGKLRPKARRLVLSGATTIALVVIALPLLLHARKRFATDDEGGLLPPAAHPPRPQSLRRASRTAAAADRDGPPPARERRPTSFDLGGWTVTAVAYREFPFARNAGDRGAKGRRADHGGLDLRAAREGGGFARPVPEGGNGYVVPGGFDPVSVGPSSSGYLKERNGRRRNKPGSYPAYRADGREVLVEGAGYSDLKTYYDDDSISVEAWANDPELAEPRACRMPEFDRFYFPTCNDFHERDFGRAFDDPEIVPHPRPENEVNIAYLASGYYRDTWILEDSPWVWPARYRAAEAIGKTSSRRKWGVSNEERTSEMVAKSYRSAILKTPRMKHSIDGGLLDGVWTEAIVMERMTKSPRIIDIYGHCSTSTMVEVVPIEFEEAAIPGEGFEAPEVVEERNRNGVRPYNNFTSGEKLRFALDMAESLADLHGFGGGVIVHDDVQMCQWLRTPDGRLKLGDFNRATIMSWDLLKGEYCKFNNGEAFSQYRAPEEFAARNLDEKIDMFSFGNNIYAMLTGLWNWVSKAHGFGRANALVNARAFISPVFTDRLPYLSQYDTDDDEVIQAELIDGKLPYIDPRYKNRSFAEKRLVELMEKCWIYDPDERVSSFEAVEFLRKAVRYNKAKGYE